MALDISLGFWVTLKPDLTPEGTVEGQERGSWSQLGQREMNKTSLFYFETKSRET